jgi:hypothetical protein
MPKITIVFGTLLTALGFVCFVLTGGQHPTSLIPAGLGTLLEIAGAIALKPNLRMHAMHMAVLVGLLGFIASVVSLIVRKPTGIALFEMFSMLVLTGVFVFLCVRSFVAARKARG